MIRQDDCAEEASTPSNTPRLGGNKALEQHARISGHVLLNERIQHNYKRLPRIPFRGDTSGRKCVVQRVVSSRAAEPSDKSRENRHCTATPRTPSRFQTTTSQPTLTLHNKTKTWKAAIHGTPGTNVPRKHVFATSTRSHMVFAQPIMLGTCQGREEYLGSV
jgi:hypothetical protein